MIQRDLPRTTRKSKEIYHEPHEPARTEKAVKFTRNICLVEGEGSGFFLRYLIVKFTSGFRTKTPKPLFSFYALITGKL